MSWLNNPRFVPVRDSVLSRLSDEDRHFRKLLPVIFLCGGYQSTRRKTLDTYLRKRHSFLLFKAEDVWGTVSHQPNANALEMERQLAALSDMVIVIVESAGTIAELGAFALTKELRSRLLPILSREHKNQSSFLNTGPVAWVDRDSRYKPSIWANHSIILDSTDELENRLTRLPKLRSHGVANIDSSDKHLLFLITDLVEIFGPCPSNHIEYYVERILGGAPKVSVDILLGLATAMEIVGSGKVSEGNKLYYRRREIGHMRTFQSDQYLRIPLLRANIVGAMMRIPEGRDALQMLDAVRA